jgi:hypothetical protein
MLIGRAVRASGSSASALGLLPLSAGVVTLSLFLASGRIAYHVPVAMGLYAIPGLLAPFRRAVCLRLIVGSSDS